MKQLITVIAKALVDYPDEVHVMKWKKTMLLFIAFLYILVM